MAIEKYASMAAMKKHEKGEGPKMAKMEKKAGIKDVVAGKAKAHKEMNFKKKTAKKK
jgi:hypothetical protein